MNLKKTGGPKFSCSVQIFRMMIVFLIPLFFVLKDRLYDAIALTVNLIFFGRIWIGHSLTSLGAPLILNHIGP